MFESSYCKSLLGAARKKQILVAILTLTGIFVFASCSPQTVVVEREVTKVVTQEKVVEQTVEVKKEITKIVKETVQIEVTATPTPIPQGGILNMTSIGDASILNPLLADDDASEEVIDLLLASPFEIDPGQGRSCLAWSRIGR